MCLKYQERTEKMKVNFKKICVPFQVVFVHTPPDQSTVELKLSLQRFRHLFQTETKGTFLLTCLLYTSPSPRDRTRSRMPSSA